MTNENVAGKWSGYIKLIKWFLINTCSDNCSIHLFTLDIKLKYLCTSSATHYYITTLNNKLQVKWLRHMISEEEFIQQYEPIWGNEDICIGDPFIVHSFLSLNLSILYPTSSQFSIKRADSHISGSLGPFRRIADVLYLRLCHPQFQPSAKSTQLTSRISVRCRPRPLLSARNSPLFRSWEGGAPSAPHSHSRGSSWRSAQHTNLFNSVWRFHLLLTNKILQVVIYSLSSIYRQLHKTSVTICFPSFSEVDYNF